VIPGNLDAEKRDRAFMDRILEWRPIDRASDDVRRPFARSRFGDTPADGRAEDHGIKPFAFRARAA